MKTVYLLRHAKSSWEDPSLDDVRRPLAPRGRRAAPAMGAFMAGNGLVPQRVLCSAATRAVETWDLVEDELERSLGVEIPTEIRKDLYAASPATLLAILRTLPDPVESVLLVGHNPTMENLALSLAGTGDGKALDILQRKYPTAALAIVDVPIRSWEELEPGRGHLRNFVRPRDLT